MVWKMFSILLIEDDEALFQEIKYRLKQWSYDVNLVQSIEHVMDDFILLKQILIIIDIQLPKYDGFHWCRIIREYANTPIIFLSSRDHPTHIVMSMQLGADDYVQKPFHFDVLIAKINAIMRRTYNHALTEQTYLKVLRSAKLDINKNIVSNEHGTIELTRNEMYILTLITERKNQLVTRVYQMTKLWDGKRFVRDNTLTVNVNRLRKKRYELKL